MIRRRTSSRSQGRRSTEAQRGLVRGGGMQWVGQDARGLRPEAEVADDRRRGRYYGAVDEESDDGDGDYGAARTQTQAQHHVLQAKVPGTAAGIFGVVTLSMVLVLMVAGASHRMYGSGAQMAAASADAAASSASTSTSTSTGAVVRDAGDLSPMVSAEQTLSFTVSNDYTERNGPIGEQYPWFKNVIIDVLRPATLSVVDSSESDDAGEVTYEWSVGLDSLKQSPKTMSEQAEKRLGRDESFVYVTRDAPATFTTTSASPSTTIVFENVGDHIVTLRRLVDGEVSTTTTGTVTAKYVRREIRQLTDEDRNAFLDAMQVMYNLDTASGMEKYGDGYLSATWFATLHNNMAGDWLCDHFHDGLGFTPWHGALTNRFEQVLQLINPTLTIPYWDYTIDGQAWQDAVSEGADPIKAYKEHISESMMFDNNWFGTMHPAATYVTEGRWANLKHPRHADGLATGLKNPFGYIRSPWNMNPSPYVSRFRGINGYFVEASPVCGTHYDLLDPDDYPDYQTYGITSQYTPHGLVHTEIAGSGHAHFYERFLAAGVSEHSATLLGFVSFTHVKKMYRYGVLQCPTECSLEAVDECRCSCPHMGNDSTSWFTYDQVEEMLGTLNRYAVDKDTGASLTQEVLDIECTQDTPDAQPAYVGDLLESSAPSDPVFWVIHPTMERLFQRWDMTAERTYEWPDSNARKVYQEGDGGQCMGHRSMDLMDFSGLFPEGVSKSLVEMAQELRGNKDTMNYVYENFMWTHCAHIDGIPADFSVTSSGDDDDSGDDLGDD